MAEPFKGHEEILQEVTARMPRLLRAEQLPLVRRPDACRAALLTFENGRLLVTLERREAGLRVSFGSAAPPDHDAFERADQDDPWWSVMGQELVHAWALASPTTDRAGLELQFRRDADRPKLVRFTADADSIALAATAKPAVPS